MLDKNLRELLFYSKIITFNMLDIDDLKFMKSLCR